MNVKNIRMQAREALKGKWKFALFTVLLMWVVGSVYQPPYFIYDMNLELIWSIGVTFLVVGPVSMGASWMFLDIWDGEDVAYNTSFNPIRNYRKVVALSVVLYVMIMVGSLLFVVPGVILALMFSQSIYLLKDNPSSSIGECLAGSRLRMKGNKRRLLMVMLSFIGFLLPPVVAMLLAILFMQGTQLGALVFLGSILYFLVIGFYLIPVMSTTAAGFYRTFINPRDVQK